MYVVRVNPPHREAFNTIANRADPDQAAFDQGLL